MNRDEFLTKLAMELEEWPDYLGDRHWTEVLGGSCEVRISRNEWLAERARLINKPGWMIAPEWARYRAQGEGGEWQFFDDTPRMGKYLSFGSASRVYTAIHGRIPAGHDWRTTLESRPVDVTPEEDEAWSAFDESRIDRIAQSDGSGDHYGVSGSKIGKYHREVKPGVWIDVYDVLKAWSVQNPALQHLIKKALAPGQRGHKTLEKDMQDIVDSAIRAKEIEE